MSVQKVNQTTGATTPIAGVPAATINGIRDNINKNGSKNLMPITAEIASSTVYGVTFTVYSDGHIRVNGTANNPGDTGVNFIYSVHNTELNLPKGRYTFSCAGLPNNNTFQSVIDVADASEAYVKRIAYIASLSLTTFDIDYADYKYIYAFLHVANGTTVNNVDVYPMLRLASDPDDTYVPHAMSNREITDRLNAVNPDASLNHTFTTQGETWTAPCDGYIMGSVDYRDTSGDIKLTVYGSDLSKGFLTYIRVVYVANINASAALFVKKGMKLNLEIYRNLSNDGSWCRFRAIG